MIVHVPSLRSRFVDDRGVLESVWSAFIGNVAAWMTQMSSPGLVVGFEPSQADVTDASKFVQSGPTTGLGVGAYLGWAYCNGNNGTTDRVTEFAAFTTLVPLMRIA